MTRIDQDILLKDWIQIWLKNYTKGIAENTKNGYTLCTSYMMESLGHLKVRDLKPIQFIELFNDLKELGYTKYTIRHIKMVTHKVLQKATENGLIHMNPVPEKILFQDYEPPKKALSQIEQQEMIKYIIRTDYRYAEMILVLLLSGLRSGELRALTTKDIDFEKGVLRIDKTTREYTLDSIRHIKIVKPKTKTSTREIPLTDQLEKYLRIAIQKKQMRDQCGKQEFGDLIFSKEGNALRQCDMYSIFRQLSDQLIQEGILTEGLTPHMLRHTFTTRAVESGMSIKFLSQVLGHSTIKMTLQHYTHHDNEYLAKEIKKLG